jgi:hypothetical protein
VEGMQKQGLNERINFYNYVHASHMKIIADELLEKTTFRNATIVD